MIQTIWLVAEEGMERVTSFTTPPTHYASSKKHKIFRVDIPLPDVVKVDGHILIEEGGIHLESPDLDGSSMPPPFVPYRDYSLDRFEVKK